MRRPSQLIVPRIHPLPQTRFIEGTAADGEAIWGRGEDEEPVMKQEVACKSILGYKNVLVYVLVLFNGLVL